MLRGLQKASSNWLGKAVMALVVGFMIISFGIWGIGDIFRGGQATAVAKVGRSELSVDQFRNRYSEQLQQFSRQIGRPITPGLAQSLGIEQQVLSQTIADMALNERARQLGLGLSNAEITKQIMANPAFHGADGKFDQATFLYRLREANYTEQRFVSEMRQEALRRQIIGAIGAGLTPPKASAEVIENYRGEERSIDYVQIDGSKVGEVPKPSPEELTSYFEAHKFAFRAPEYRKVEILTVSQPDIANTVEVSEEDARRAYQDRQKQFGTPERRHVIQISFASADDAKRASDRITGGLSFDDLVKEPEIAGKVVDLGTVTKPDIIDPAVANAAFGLAEGAVSGPVKGRFGTVMLRAVKVEPASVKPFKEVEAELKRDLATARAKDEVSKIRDKVEEELGGSASFEEIAKKLNLKLRTIEAVDRSGRDPGDKPVADLPAGVDVVNSAFNAEIGTENDALTLPSGGFVWYNVVSNTPSRDRTLDEVKARAESRFREDEITKRLDAKAAELVGKLNGGASINDVAKAEGLKVETKWGLKRESTLMPPRVIAAIFRVAKDQAGSAEGEKPDQRVIFRVTDVKTPPFAPDSADTAKMIDQLKESYNNDIMGQYVTRLENEIGTDINQKALAQATGRTSSEDSGGY